MNRNRRAVRSRQNSSNSGLPVLTPDDVFDGAYKTLHENEGIFRYDSKTGESTCSVAQDAAINSSSYRQLLNLAAN
ncbi:MAG: hypothetical protein K2H82_09125 [Oscillospiraceae bacterium]|nr:hypothetical protein [Oscillospiraceae bacterium]